MKHTLAPLPYEIDALEPHMSRETLEFHYGRHHQTYVTTLNTLIVGTPFENDTLEAIIQKAPAGPLVNNAAQVWNHTFFWNSLSPNGGKAPSGALSEAMNAKWGSYEAFQEAWTKAALTLFGSGWVWLIRRTDGTLAIVQTSNAATILSEGTTALLTLDVWEHAYYIDYRNARPKFVESFWNIVNWDFASRNFSAV